jgi:hypothetical protein
MYKGKVKCLAAVLQTAEPREFHTQTYIGWFHENNESRFALMLQILETHNPKPGSKAQNIPKLSLANRFTMAPKVDRALARWHSAGWHHQAVASHDVMFLRGTDDVIQYNEPYLSSFEFSRKCNELSRDKRLYKADLDVYMHPDRRGRPPRFRYLKNMATTPSDYLNGNRHLGLHSENIRTRDRAHGDNNSARGKP